MQKLNLKSYENEVEELVNILSNSSLERDKFVEDPSAYLLSKNLNLGNANLISGSPGSTSEHCTAVLVCVYGVFVGAWTVAAVYASVAAAVAYAVVAGVWKYVAAYGVNIKNPGNSISGSFGSHLV